MNWQEANAEDELRGKWKRRLVEHGESKCPECGHTGWTHSARGCCAYVDPPLMPFKNPWTGEIQGTCIDSKLTTEELESYKCKCHNNQLCMDNASIVGMQEPPVYNEPLSRSAYGGDDEQMIADHLPGGRCNRGI